MEALVDLLVGVFVNDSLEGDSVPFCEVVTIVFWAFKEVPYVVAYFVEWSG